MEQTQAEQLSERVWRLRAPNPGPMTLTGTNSYLIGAEAERIALDPGPLIESHLQGLVAHAQAQNARISLIVVTHGHPDHFPGAARLAELTGAPVAAWSGATFPHSRNLADGERVGLADAHLVAIFTPGHAADHLCFFLEEEAALFTGDNILGTGTTVVAPPKGDMAHYLASLRLLQSGWSQAQVIYGGHGPQITAPRAKIEEYLTHRQARQDQLLAALATGAHTVPQLVERIYQDVDRRLWPAAARQVLAYLIMLEREGRLRATDLQSAQVEAEYAALLNPAGSVIDPVAAAELGYASQSGTASEKIKYYALT